MATFIALICFACLLWEACPVCATPHSSSKSPCRKETKLPNSWCLHKHNGCASNGILSARKNASSSAPMCQQGKPPEGPVSDYTVNLMKLHEATQVGTLERVRRDPTCLRMHTKLLRCTSCKASVFQSGNVTEGTVRQCQVRCTCPIRHTKR